MKKTEKKSVGPKKTKEAKVIQLRPANDKKGKKVKIASVGCIALGLFDFPIGVDLNHKYVLGVNCPDCEETSVLKIPEFKLDIDSRTVPLTAFIAAALPVIERFLMMIGEEEADEQERD